MKPNPRSHQVLKLCGLLGLTTLLAAPSSLSFEPNEWRQTQAVNVPKPGLVRVNLPAVTLDAAQPGLQDLRVLDPTGTQVPYLVERPAPEGESTLRPKEFRAIMEAGATRLIVKTGTTAPIAGVTLETPARQFVKGVQVEGSQDAASWKKLAAGEPIFQLLDGARKLRVSFAEGTWEFLRLAIDDQRSAPVPFTGAQLHKARARAPSETVPMTIKSRDESLGVTRLDVDVGAANLTLESLRIETRNPLFTRSITLAAPELGDGGIRERTIADGMIYRVNVNGKSDEILDVPVELQIQTRELLVLIRNEDSPPLSIDVVRGERRLVRVVFFANQAGHYSLLSGNSQCAAPHYDLSALSEQLRNTIATEVVPSSLTLNPNYKPSEPLAALTLTGAKVDIATWKFRKLLPLSRSGVQQVELDPEVLAHALPDQRDLRVVRAERQLPFLLERTSISRPINLNATAASDSKKPTLSRWSLKMPQAALPITRLACTSSSPLFHREIRLWEEVTDERGDKFSRELGHAAWDQTPARTPRDFVLELNTAPQSDTLLLETDNGDNPPIELRDFRSYYPAARVVFKASLDPAEPLWLYYGNYEANAPRYDLALVTSELLRAERSAIVPGSQESFSSRVSQIGETLTGSSRYIFWAALGLVVIALLAIMSRFLPKPP
jgi:Protein of unknown function (DUF3999)